MHVTILGTSSMVPTKDRNQVAVYLEYEGKGLLFDCGEGTQRQFKKAKKKLSHIHSIFITHWHGDHVLGLPGVFQTLSAGDYGKTLYVYGPKGTKKHIDHLFKAFEFENSLDLQVQETESGKVVENDQYIIEALPLEHGVPVLGYRFTEKEKRKVDMKKAKKLGVAEGPDIGKLQKGESVVIGEKNIEPDEVSSLVDGKIVSYITDTRLCDNCFALAQQADLLVCESTYGAEFKEKSEEYFHMTTKEAGQLARDGGVNKLVLLHFSARYKQTDDLLDEVKELFDDVVCADDLMEFSL